MTTPGQQQAEMLKTIFKIGNRYLMMPMWQLGLGRMMNAWPLGHGAHIGAGP